ncbi:hypothetical protein D9M71_90610 [compost metagenome]
MALGLFLQLAGLCFVPDGSRYTTIANLSLFLPALLSLPLFRPWTQWSRSSILWLLALLFWVLGVALLNEGSEGGAVRWLRVTLYAWLYVSAISVVMQDRVLWNRLLGAVVLVCGLFAALSLVQALFIEERGWTFRAFRLASWGGHEMADFRNPIVSALYFGMLLLVALHLASRSAGVLRWLYSLAAVLMLAYLYFTYSRGVWAAGVVGAFVLFWSPADRRTAFRWLLATASLVLVILLWLGWNKAVDMSFRDVIFYGWWHQIQAFWLWGFGAGADANICISELNRCFNQAHSLYLQFTFEYGLPGLLLLLAFVWVLARNGLRLRGHDDMATLALALVAFMLVSAVANYYVIFLRPGVFWMVFWVPAGMLVAMSSRLCVERV